MKKLYWDRRCYCICVMTEAVIKCKVNFSFRENMTASFIVDMNDKNIRVDADKALLIKPIETVSGVIIGKIKEAILNEIYIEEFDPINFD